jgi:hypothetical protein
MVRMGNCCVLAVLVVWVAGVGSVARTEEKARGDDSTQEIVFTRDIVPILSNNCYFCHGPDEATREADLRLDLEQAVFDPDYPIVVRGDPEESPLYQRIAEQDADLRMPPAHTNKQLSDRQKQLVRRWIEQGAVWQQHWSFIKPSRPTPPRVDVSRRGGNAIDQFVVANLDELGLEPGPEADRVTLARRLYFDLTGLPPTPHDVDAFVADTSPDAYQRLVDRLLDSPHFGERLAVYWLDVVRYADSNGYHSDEPRQIAPYRDYVISTFNDNKPFDQFIVEQLAGDLLPDATPEARIASGFNMLLQTTNEGGAQAKEYLAKYSADRVRSTGTIFLGATLGCCECHNHKFDPFTTKDFYSLAAVFADIQEQGVGNPPAHPVMTEHSRLEIEQADRRLAELRAAFAAAAPADESAEAGDRQPGELTDQIAAILRLPEAQRSDDQRQQVTAFYESVQPAQRPVLDEIGQWEQKKKQIHDSLPRTLMTVAGTPRPIRLLARGNWMDDSGPVMEPAIPEFLGRLEVGDRRATRLDLARWIADAENPLTARTFVNRLWKLFFGRGLAQPLDDLGAQGTPPTHPELLDWLAVEFTDSGWDVKYMVRLLVGSAAYRQTSHCGEALRAADPYNQYYARQSRFRLDAEFVRDNALAVSGLLIPELGGRSVKPYQPAGYWEHLNFPKRTWQQDSGDNLYRRGLYTWWQRMFLHPSLLAFDASTREECTVDRPRSNTPQQALVLLNDPTYVEAARALATRIIQEGGADPGERLNWAYRRVLSRDVRPAETQTLVQILQQHLADYRQNPEAARQLTSIGASPPPAEVESAELAAWTSVARVILNLHETITRS